MTRARRTALPWHPAWHSAPLLGTQRSFYYLTADVGGGQSLVCLRCLLAAMRLSWQKWGGTVRVLARASGMRALRGLSPRGGSSLLLAAHHVPELLYKLCLVLADGYPSGSRRVCDVVEWGWVQSWADVQAAEHAKSLAGEMAEKNPEETPPAPSNEPQATPAAPDTPGAVLRAARGRYFLRPTDLPEMRDAARRMRRTGHSFMQIGRRLGVSKATAYRLVCDDLPNAATQRRAA